MTNDLKIKTFHGMVKSFKEQVEKVDPKFDELAGMMQNHVMEIMDFRKEINED